MTSKLRFATLAASVAALVLAHGEAAWAGPQEAPPRQAQDQAYREGGVFVFQERGFQQDEALRRQRDDDERQRREIRIRPTISMGNVWRFRSSSVVSTVLANADELNLTDAQESAIGELRREARRAEIRRDADIEIAELDLEDMMAEPRDLDAIEAKMRELANLRVDDQMEELRLERAVLALLDDAQRDQVEEMAPGRLLIEGIRRR